MARSRSHRFRRACGSSDPVGSSRNITSGRCTSAQAIESRCAWPPESFSVRVAAALGQADHFQHLVGAPGRDPVEVGEGAQLLPRAEPLEEGRRLQLNADPGQQGRVPRPRPQAEDRHLAAVRLAQPFHDLKGGGLPRPVRTEDAEELAGVNLEAHPVHRAQVPIGLPHVPDGDSRGHPRNLTGHPTGKPDMRARNEPGRSACPLGAAPGQFVTPDGAVRAGLLPLGQISGLRRKLGE